MTAEYDRIEQGVLDAVSRMFPDYDFTGCYDISELLSHAEGQVEQLRTQVYGLSIAFLDANDTETPGWFVCDKDGPVEGSYVSYEEASVARRGRL